MAQTTTTGSEIERYFDDAIESLRWCSQNLGKRLAVEKLRQLEISLSAITLAIDHEMDGRLDESREALIKADWRFGMRHALDNDNFVIECG